MREYAFPLVTADGVQLEASATHENGTAYYALRHDPLYAEGSTTRATGYLVNVDRHIVFVVQALKRGTSHENLVIDSAAVSLDELRDKAQGNLYMDKANLFCLLDSLSPGSPQAYAVTTQLRKQHRDRSYETEISEHDAVCCV